MMLCSTSHPPKFEDALHHLTLRPFSVGGFGSGLLLTSIDNQVIFSPTPQSSISVACLCLGTCAISVHAMERPFELCMLWQARPKKIDPGCSDGIVTSALLKPGGRD